MPVCRRVARSGVSFGVQAYVQNRVLYSSCTWFRGSLAVPGHNPSHVDTCPHPLVRLLTCPCFLPRRPSSCRLRVQPHLFSDGTSSAQTNPSRGKLVCRVPEFESTHCSPCRHLWSRCLWFRAALGRERERNREPREETSKWGISLSSEQIDSPVVPGNLVFYTSVNTKIIKCANLSK